MIAVAGHSSSGVGPTATLFETLEAWRQDRSSMMLADRVDEAAAHIEQLAVPANLHRWWTERARTYDPVVATTLLATLHVQTRGSDTSWRTILSRDTPLVAELRAAGFSDATRLNIEWMNLVDRIGFLLAWPDDPRVAVALADVICRPFRKDRTWVTEPQPMVTAIVKRITAIGDLRAIERVYGGWHDFGEACRPHIVDALVRAPAPRAPAQLAPTARSLESAWQAVVAEPHAIAPRLVLADAYMERDDPRGELIALQCAPLVASEKARASGEPTDASRFSDANAGRIAQLIATHRQRWLGEVTLVVEPDERFHGGLLLDVSVSRATPTWAWERVVDHRELCAIDQMRVWDGIDFDPFADFIAAHTRKPRWLRVTSDMIERLRARCGTLSLPGIELYDLSGALSVAADRVLALSPDLERLGLDWSGDLADLRALAYRRPSLNLDVTVERIEDRAIFDELRTLPNVKIVSRDGS